MGRKSNSRCRAASQSAACILGCLTQGGALPESHLPWAIIVRPVQGFIWLLRRQDIW
jgi:hypothetical protein